MNRLPLHADLYLIAHDQSGKPLIHQSSMTLGLAGAALLELALSERVVVARDRRATAPGQGIVARARDEGRPTGDAVSDALLPLVSGDGDVRYVIKKAADGIRDRTRAGLVASGVLRRVAGRRMGMLPYTRYEVADIASVVRASSGVRAAVEGWKPPDARCAALCGLVAVLRLEEELYLDQPSNQLVGRLRELVTESAPLVGALVGVVETLVGEAALAVYR
ncbi:GPP34 family phosphoprotein [Nonomuraea sp. K274]|uniref:GPP34 family phosphoprotein n=1 Tax=Nonomuraea cypriaca TaxID=1187855 RepID=A0A931F4M4_9ACTN|nr:GPP34 family phosphoprotein [Nonomuraea cypriaca]MBF8191271.1 GPP34 family phosphoprotein [Nonomuraea cypriaca]